MLTYRDGNLFEDTADAIVNPINCMGVMGAGLALLYKQAYPANYDAYRARCLRREVKVGEMFVFKFKDRPNPRYIVNFPTKIHWRDGSKLDYIQVGLADLVRVVHAYELKSVALPRIGCGLGQLSWPVVNSLIKEYAEGLQNVDIRIYGEDV